MIRITATYKGPTLPVTKSFQGTRLYILFPTFDSWGEFFIHGENGSRYYYQNAKEFLNDWRDVRLYTHKIDEQDKTDTINFLINTLKLKDF